MFRVAGIEFGQDLIIEGKEASVTLPASLTKKTITALQNATFIEVLGNDYSTVLNTVYIKEWKKIEITRNGLLFVWRIVTSEDYEYLRNDIENLREALLNAVHNIEEANHNIEDLTVGLLEIAEILGESGDAPEEM